MPPIFNQGCGLVFEELENHNCDPLEQYVIGYIKYTFECLLKHKMNNVKRGIPVKVLVAFRQELIEIANRLWFWVHKYVDSTCVKEIMEPVIDNKKVLESLSNDGNAIAFVLLSVIDRYNSLKCQNFLSTHTYKMAIGLLYNLVNYIDYDLQKLADKGNETAAHLTKSIKKFDETYRQISRMDITLKEFLPERLVDFLDDRNVCEGCFNNSFE